MLRKGVIAAITVALIASVSASAVAADQTATLEIQLSGMDPSWHQGVCVWAERPEWGRPKHFEQCGVAVDGKLTLDTLPPGKVRLLLDSQGEYFGAQWLGEDGGSGEVEGAAVVELKAGMTTAAPKARIDAADQITGFVYNTAAIPQNIVGACATVVPGYSRLTGCISRPDYAYSIRMLGPYKWPVYFTAPGYAGQWRGGSPDRQKADLLTLPYPFSISESVQVQGKVTLDRPCCTAGQKIEAFNAATGDLIATAQGSPAQMSGLPSVRYVLRQTNADGSVCWFKNYPRPLRFGTPYFAATAGRTTVLSGLNCQGEEPMLLTQPTVPGRLPPLTQA